jgi:hypothetical protein
MQPRRQGRTLEPALLDGRRIVRAIVGLVFVVAMSVGAGTAMAACSCQCVEGIPHTLCNTVDEARATPYACGAGPARVACPLPPAPDHPPLEYPAPPGAGNCHSVRLWDPHSSEYSVAAKVCEATAAAGSDAMPGSGANEASDTLPNGAP